MEIFQDPKQFHSGKNGVCLSIGFFDGVHIGHQNVINNSTWDAREASSASVAVTFAPHPSAVVSPKNLPPLLYPLTQKLNALEALGTSGALIIPFDIEFSQKTAEAFITFLLEGFGKVWSITIGQTFTFGHKRGGNVQVLKELGHKYGFETHAIAPVLLDGEPVSSTRIRQAVQQGNFVEASRLLGRPYSMSGTIVKGDKIGQQLGFPTANLSVTGLSLPPSGVYSTVATWRGKQWKAAVNIGNRPTLGADNPTMKVEAHLLDFNRNLYGEVVELEFKDLLRPEKKFDSLDQLKKQIASDVASVRVA